VGCRVEQSRDPSSQGCSATPGSPTGSDRRLWRSASGSRRMRRCTYSRSRAVKTIRPRDAYSSEQTFYASVSIASCRGGVSVHPITINSSDRGNVSKIPGYFHCSVHILTPFFEHYFYTQVSCNDNFCFTLNKNVWLSVVQWIQKLNHRLLENQCDSIDLEARKNEFYNRDVC